MADETTDQELCRFQPPLSFNIELPGEPGYTDAQFRADLKKSNKLRRQMIAEALEEDAKGETLEFPV